MDCNGSGYTSSVIAGIDWIARNASGPSVANMSIGGGADGTMDKAIANAVAKGITFVVAAGNSGANACDYSPSRATAAITVGATSGDSRAGYSNYGSCVDIFAPGTSITSTWSSGNSATATISGTSMASPHVAGVAALYLEANRSASPAAVAQAITDNATMDVVADAGTGSPNRHVFMGFIAAGSGGGVSCSGLTCSFNGGASTDDGSIAGYQWSFGDGSIATGSNVTRTYMAAGDYQVTLTVTDNVGATGSLTKTASASAPVPVDLILSARVVKKGANRMVQLSWTGANSVEVKRDGQFVTVANGTSYQDNRGKNPGSATYLVCTGGSCSNSIVVSY
jgi:subtilisin family serine protease